MSERVDGVVADEVVTVGLPRSLAEEVELLAQSQATTVAEVLAPLVRIGLDAELGGSTSERLDAVEQALADLRALLEELGGMTRGTQRLLLKWAQKPMGVTEEDLAAEMDALGQEEFALRMSRRDVFVSGPRPRAAGGGPGSVE